MINKAAIQNEHAEVRNLVKKKIRTDLKKYEEIIFTTVMEEGSTKNEERHFQYNETLNSKAQRQRV